MVLVESWAAFALLAALLWSLSTVIDKFVLGKLVKNPVIPTLFVGALGVVVSVAIYVAQGWQRMPIEGVLWALASGVLFFLGVLFYYRAAKECEISTIAALYYLAPLFIAVMAAAFLNEFFTPKTYTGIIAVVAGGVLLSIQDFKTLSLKKGVGIRVLSVFFFACTSVIMKYLLSLADYWTVFSYRSIAMALVLSVALAPQYKNIKADIIAMKKKTIALISFSELLTIAGVLLVTLSASLGPVTLTGTLSATSPFFTLLLVVFLSLFHPKILKEEITRKTISRKAIAMLLMLAGGVLMAS